MIWPNRVINVMIHSETVNMWHNIVVMSLIWLMSSLGLWYSPDSTMYAVQKSTKLCDCLPINTLRLRQNGSHFADDIFKCIFLNQNAWISLKISLKFAPKVRINNIPALVQIMAWHRLGDKPLSEPMMVSLLTHICVTWPQWVKTSYYGWSFVSELDPSIAKHVSM